MKEIRLMLIGVIFIGTLLLGVGLYLAFKPEAKSVEPLPVVQNTIVNSSTPPTVSSRILYLDSRSAEWQEIGSGHFTVKVNGTINFGGISSNPEGVVRGGPGKNDSMAPDYPFGAVIGKIGENGKPFKVGSKSYNFDSTQSLYLAVNDSTYEDNSGSYTVTITGK